MLYVARAAEEHAGKQLSPEDYTRALVESVTGSDALGFFIEAMTLTRRRQDLAPLVERTVERLHAEGLRAYAGEMAARGWHSRLDPETSARRFWAVAIGVTLEGHAMGRSSDDLAAEMLRLIGARPMRLRKQHGSGLSPPEIPLPTYRPPARRNSHHSTSHSRAGFNDRSGADRGAPRSTWKSVALIAHAWTLILGVIAMVAVWPNSFTFL